MTTPEPEVRRSPFQGLVPYAEADAAWFFGRDEWREIIIDNLRAYRLSILYGASGVGKSSVLDAGVVRAVRALARQGLAERGAPELVVVRFSSWSAGDPVAALKAAVEGAVERGRPGARARPRRAPSRTSSSRGAAGSAAAC